MQGLADRLQSAFLSMELYRIAQDDFLLFLLLFFPQIELCVLHCAHERSERQSIYSACSLCIQMVAIARSIHMYGLLIAFEGQKYDALLRAGRL